MHKHKRKANYVMHCDASDHALAAIIIEAPTEEDIRQPFYRRLWPHEATGRRSSASSLAIAMHT